MKFPNMHKELKFYLEHLSDSNYQKKTWVCGNNGKHYVSFDSIIHFIIDDARLDREENDHVGSFLRNVDEAERVREVAMAIHRILDVYGPDLTDADYIAKPEWQDVLATARTALAVVRSKPSGPANTE